MFYFEAILILLLIYGVYIYAPYMLNNKQWRQHDRLRTIYTNENADVREPRRRKHYPQPLPRPVYRYIPPNFYANQSSMLYYSGLPTGKALSDWSNLM